MKKKFDFKTYTPSRGDLYEIAMNFYNTNDYAINENKLHEANKYFKS